MVTPGPARPLGARSRTVIERDRAADRWRGVAVYLALAFGLAWVVQIALVLALRDIPGGLASLGAGVVPVALFLMWPPAIGAFVARRRVERCTLRDTGLVRPSWRYVAWAWFLPVALTLLALLISLPVYPFDPRFETLEQLAAQTGKPLPAPPAVLVLANVAFALTLAVPINSVFAFGEEFGWRGYLLPRLMDNLGTWPGLLAHGAIWGFWHAPLIFLSGYNYPGHHVLGVPLFIVACVLLGVIFGWLRIASGSVWPPTVAHGAFNAIAALPLLLLRGVDPAVGGVLYSPLGWLVMLGAIGVLLWRGALPPLHWGRGAGSQHGGHGGGGEDRGNKIPVRRDAVGAAADVA